MNTAIERRLLIAWLALSALSVLQQWLSASGPGATYAPQVLVTVGVLTMATIKTHFIIREFMDVRHAPAWLKRATAAWAWLTGGLLLGIYLAGTLQAA